MGKKVWHYLLMLTIYTTHDPAILSVHISPKGRCMCARVRYIRVYTHVFMHKNVYRSPQCSQLQLEATQMLVPISSRTKYVNCVINHNWTWNSDKEWSTVVYNTGESHKWNVNDRSQTHKHTYCVTPFTGSTNAGQASQSYQSGLPWSEWLAGSRGGSQDAGELLSWTGWKCSGYGSSSSIHLQCIHFLHKCSSIKC